MMYVIVGMIVPMLVSLEEIIVSVITSSAYPTESAKVPKSEDTEGVLEVRSDTELPDT